MDKATKNTDSLTMLELNVKVELTVTLKMITPTASHSYFLFLFKTWSSLKVFIIYDLSKTN